MAFWYAADVKKFSARIQARAGARRLAVIALVLTLLAPCTGFAQEKESHWYDGLKRGTDYAADILLIRPAALATLLGGALLFVPAAVMTSPGGRGTIEEAWELFVLLPGQNLWEKPLGEI